MNANRTVFFLLFLALAGCQSAPPPAVTPAAAPRVTDLDGRPSDPLGSLDGRRATVLIFVTNDCPISNGYAPEIHRLCEAYTKRDISFFLVYADPDLSPADARQHYKDYAYRCPAVFDHGHALARKTGVTVTPEAAVFLPDGRLIYRGRINDLYVDYGKSRYAPTTHDLKDVLETIAQSRPLAPRTTQAVGCPIPM